MKFFRCFINLLVVFFVVGLFTFLGNASEKSNEKNMLNMLIQGVKHGESLLKSGQVTFIVKTELGEDTRAEIEKHREENKSDYSVVKPPPVPKQEITEITLTFKSSRVRKELKYLETNDERKKTIRHVWVYDGQKTLQLLEQPGHNMGMTEDNKINLTVLNWIRGGSNVSESLSEILSNRKNKLSFVGKEDLGSFYCYVVEVAEENGTKIKLWIDPQINYRCRKIEEKYENHASIIERKFRRYNDTLWYPYESIEESPSIKRTIKVEKIVLNAEIPESELELVFPSGTLVTDESAGVSFVTP